jgi:hypothetical protein
MSEILQDKSLGLVLKGYNLIPNGSLATKIGIYTPLIIETILQEHPEEVDKWLRKLHTESIRQKKLCLFENDTAACFNIEFYDHFEKGFKSWEEGGLIKIMLTKDRSVWVSKKPLFIHAK